MAEEVNQRSRFNQRSTCEVQIFWENYSSGFEKETKREIILSSIDISDLFVFVVNHSPQFHMCTFSPNQLFAFHVNNSWKCQSFFLFLLLIYVTYISLHSSIRFRFSVTFLCMKSLLLHKIHCCHKRNITNYT